MIFLCTLLVLVPVDVDVDVVVVVVADVVVVVDDGAVVTVTTLSLRFENTSETRRQVRSLPFELPNYRFCLERLELLGDAVWGPRIRQISVFESLGGKSSSPKGKPHYLMFKSSDMYHSPLLWLVNGMVYDGFITLEPIV